MTTLTLLLLALVCPTLLWAQADTLWTRLYPDLPRAHFADVLPLPGGGCVIAGSQIIMPDTLVSRMNLGVWKFDAAGGVEWSASVEGAPEPDPVVVKGKAVCAAADGAVMVLGERSVNSTGRQSLLLLKISLAGEILWTREYAFAPSFNYAASMAPTLDGGFILGGNTYAEVDPEHAARAFLLRVTADGDSVWGRTYGGEYDLGCSDVIATSDGGYAFTGRGASRPVHPSDLAVVKTDGEGNELWRASAGEDYEWEYPLGIVETADGGYAVGAVWPRNMLGHAWLLRFDGDGELLWERIWQDCDTCSQNPTVFLQTADGRFLIGGHEVYDTRFDSPFFLFQADADGQPMWEYRLEEGRVAGPFAMAVAEAGTFLIAGQSGRVEDHGFGWPWVVSLTEGSSALEPASAVAAEYRLLEAYPNPFNPRTRLRFGLAGSAMVNLSLFDVMGRHVRTLQNGHLAAGDHTVPVDGSHLPAGVYFARLTTNGAAQTRKLLLLK